MMKASSSERKNKKIAIFIASLLVLILCSWRMSTAEMYRWVDENGGIQITDTPPPKLKSSGEVKIYREIQEEIQSSEPASDVKMNPSKPSVERKKNPSVTLYGTSWCSYCRKAREFFRSRGIDFIDYDIEKDKEAAIRKNELDSQSGVPFAIINGRSIHGYSESAYEKALKE